MKPADGRLPICSEFREPVPGLTFAYLTALVCVARADLQL